MIYRWCGLTMGDLILWCFFSKKSKYQNVLVTLPTDNLGQICTRLSISKIHQMPQVRVSDTNFFVPSPILAFQKSILTIVPIYMIILKSNKVRFCRFLVIRTWSSPHCLNKLRNWLGGLSFRCLNFLTSCGSFCSKHQKKT